MSKRNSLQKITEKAALYGETAPNIPLVEISGDNRVLIENHVCVSSFDDSKIDVRMSYGTVRVCGTSLDMACVNRHQMVIRGKIDSVSLFRGVRNE